MLIKDFQLGQLQTNCYIVTDEKTLECAIIDPGCDSSTILAYVEENKLNPRFIFLTHGHFDHTLGVAGIKDEAPVSVYINEKDARETPEHDPYRYLADKSVKYYADGDQISLGDLLFEVMTTPGHSPGSVTLRCQDALFTGDTLFRGSCGRTDLPGGSMEELNASLRRLYELEGNYEVYPGHSLSSSLDMERRFNPYMRKAAGLPE